MLIRHSDPLGSMKGFVMHSKKFFSKKGCGVFTGTNVYTPYYRLTMLLNSSSCSFLSILIESMKIIKQHLCSQGFNSKVGYVYISRGYIFYILWVSQNNHVSWTRSSWKEHLIINERAWFSTSESKELVFLGQSHELTSGMVRLEDCSCGYRTTQLLRSW